MLLGYEKYQSLVQKDVTEHEKYQSLVQKVQEVDLKSLAHALSEAKDYFSSLESESSAGASLQIVPSESCLNLKFN